MMRFDVWSASRTRHRQTARVRSTADVISQNETKNITDLSHDCMGRGIGNSS